MSEENSTPEVEQSTSNNKLPLLLSAVAILIAVIAAIYLLTFKPHQPDVGSSPAIQTLRSDIANLQATQDQQQGDLEKINNTASAAWNIEQAKYLVHLANYQLEYQHNVDMATTLLHVAKDKLFDINSKQQKKLRLILSNNIKQLNQTPRIDAQLIYNQLSKLSKMTQALHIADNTKPMPVSKKTTDKQPSNDQKESSWKRGLDKTLSALSKMVIIERNNNQVAPLLSPNQVELARYQLQLLITQAQSALLTRQQLIYENSLSQAQDLLKQNFSHNVTQTKDINARITKLKGININPKLPNLEKTLEAFNQSHDPKTKKQPPKDSKKIDNKKNDKSKKPTTQQEATAV